MQNYSPDANVIVANNVGTQYFFSLKQLKGFAVEAKRNNRKTVTRRFIDGNEFTASCSNGHNPKKAFDDHRLIICDGPGIVTKLKDSPQNILNEINRSN
jgi:hypothetical protein